MARSRPRVYRVLAIGVLAGAIIAACVRVEVARSDDLRSIDGVFTIHIEADRPEYTIGDPILIDVSVKNVTRDEYLINALPPCIAVTLEVTDETGRSLPSAYRGCPARVNAAEGYVLEPGASQQLYAIVDAQRTKWTPLATFGFSLTEPGTYTIRAVPQFDGFRRSNGAISDRFQTVHVPRSNAVTIRILP